MSRVEISYHDIEGKAGSPVDYSQLTGKPTLGDSSALDVGTASGTVAAGDHDHSIVTTGKKGFVPPLSGESLQYFSGAGTWAPIDVLYPIGIVIYTSTQDNPSTMGIPGTWIPFNE